MRGLDLSQELSSEITTTSTRAATAAKLSSEDQGQIAQLKKDIEKTWASVEQARDT